MNRKHRAVVTVSQGTMSFCHALFSPSDSALMIPRTSDGRVLFAIPWHDRVVVGTTDDPVPRSGISSRKAMPENASTSSRHIERYLGRRQNRHEICSVWSGQRPLVRRAGISKTAALSRDHTILDFSHETDHSYGREVDHLSEDGRRRDRPRGPWVDFRP